MSAALEPRREPGPMHPSAQEAYLEAVRRALWMMAAEDAELLAAMHRVAHPPLEGPRERVSRRHRAAS